MAITKRRSQVVTTPAEDEAIASRSRISAALNGHRLLAQATEDYQRATEGNKAWAYKNLLACAAAVVANESRLTEEERAEVATKRAA